MWVPQHFCSVSAADRPTRKCFPRSQRRAHSERLGPLKLLVCGRVSEVGFASNDASGHPSGKSRPAGALLRRSYREWRRDRLYGGEVGEQRIELRGQKAERSLISDVWPLFFGLCLKKIRAGWLSEPPAVGTCQIDRSGGRAGLGAFPNRRGSLYLMRIHHLANGYSYAAGRVVMAAVVNAPCVPTGENDFRLFPANR
jgi:hypothetical protein